VRSRKKKRERGDNSSCLPKEGREKKKKKKRGTCPAIKYSVPMGGSYQYGLGRHGCTGDVGKKEMDDLQELVSEKKEKKKKKGGKGQAQPAFSHTTTTGRVDKGLE